jgi:hypothetical protein
VRRDAATQIDPLDLLERVIRQDGCELKGLIESGRGAGGFKIVEGEIHRLSLAAAVCSVILETTRPVPTGALPSLNCGRAQHLVGIELERAAIRARSALLRRRRPLGPSITSSRETSKTVEPSKWTPFLPSLAKSKLSATHMCAEWPDQFSNGRRWSAWRLRWFEAWR